MAILSDSLMRMRNTGVFDLDLAKHVLVSRTLAEEGMRD